MNYPRMRKIAEFLAKTNGLSGIVAEVGVYKGGTAKLICSLTPKRVLLFDTFEGLPEVSGNDEHLKGKFSDTSVSEVSEFLKGFSNFAIYKGVFPDQNSEYASWERFSFVHLDVDIYPSVRDCLGFFYPRMVKGGIIVLDDHGATDCPGAKLAADEFAHRHNLTIEPTVECQAIIRI